MQAPSEVDMLAKLRELLYPLYQGTEKILKTLEG
jgi:hypothetical protein